MIIPSFFAYDNFQSYPLGPIVAFGNSVAWSGAGTFAEYPPIYSSDSFEEYANGAINSLTGGKGWLGDGEFPTYSNT